MKRILLAFAVVCAFGWTVSAQTQPPRPDPPKEEAAKPAEFSPSHLKAAETFMEVLNLERYLEMATTRVLDAQLAANPKMAKYKPVFLEFFAKYFSYKMLKGDLARLYASNFTEPELLELARFYRTDVGQKAIRLMPELYAQGAELGQRRVAEHLTELTDMIKKFDKLNDGKTEGE